MTRHRRAPPSADSDRLPKRSRPLGISDGGGNAPEDLPMTVARTLRQGSSPVSMDFHPVQETLLLVGTNVGHIALWNIGTEQRLIHKNFEVRDLGACSVTFQASLVNDPGISVNRIIWSPDGTLFGVAYSKHIVQVYSYHGGDDIKQHLEIDAHVGSVNDIAFARPNERLSIITCGDDKTIKVWDATSGTKEYTFEGHEAPVYSVCAYNKEKIQFIFSTALDGKIKQWFYDNLRSGLDYDALGHSYATMAYSADGSRLFTCGTSKEGESFLVGQTENEGKVKWAYQGFQKQPLGVVQFDTIRNRFLAAGNDFAIKWWDMDDTNLLVTTNLGGGLPPSPRIRFNKQGTLLAVSTLDNGIKIAANADGLRMLGTFQNHSSDASRVLSETMTKPLVSPLSATTVAAATTSGKTDRAAPSLAMSAMNENNRILVDVKAKTNDESMDKSKIWKVTEVINQKQCRSLRLVNNVTMSKIMRLTYTHSGSGILGLAANAVHLLWRWYRNERNPSGKVTTTVTPRFWQPRSGKLMTNDVTGIRPEEAVPCFALSKNDSYLMSSSGGKITLFNTMSFETMADVKCQPSAATFLAFYPRDNNVIAIGLDDSTILIYKVRVDEFVCRLQGHSKRITGLAFSDLLGVLVSSGADAELCVWGTALWEKRRSRILQNTSGCTLSPILDTQVQFHKDQIHFLAVHERQIAIYKANMLQCVNQWVPRKGHAPISHAVFSCESELIYASFLDATVCIFNASSLRLQCRILPPSYLPAKASTTVYPFVIAAHPLKPNQFALGLTDGDVHIIEPLEPEGKWGVDPPVEDGSVSSVTTSSPAGSSASIQPQR